MFQIWNCEVYSTIFVEQLANNIKSIIMYQLITTLASTIAKQVEYNKRSNGLTDPSILYDEIIEHLSSNHNNVSIVEKSNKSPFRITKSTNFQYVLFDNGKELVVTNKFF